MNARDAKKELIKSVNNRYAHVTLLRDKRGSWRYELHAGLAGNCCCNQHKDFVWRETSPYTDASEVRAIFKK